MQLTNICRDVREDWERGRLYLPLELFGSSWAGRLVRPGPLAVLEEARRPVADAVRILLAEADRYYVSADEGLRHLAPRCAMAVRAARRIYAEIGEEIRRRDFDVVAGRTVVGRSRKLRLALGAVASGLVPRSSEPKGEALRRPDRVLHFAELPIP